MIILLLLVGMLIIHWVADFILQSHEEATNKSSDIGYLISHTATYSMVWFIVLVLLGGGWMGVLFTLITFIVHTIQDYFTSRWVKHYFSKGNYHNGFVVIGLDQILHYIQLILTFILLFL